MLKFVNGEYVEMTEEEVAEMKRLQEEAEQYEQNHVPSLEEQVEELKKQIVEMQAHLI